MTTLISTDVDDALVERLQVLFSATHRTVEQQARSMLEVAAGSTLRSRWAEIARSIAAMTPKGVRQTDSLVLLREDRDRDDREVPEG